MQDESKWYPPQQIGFGPWLECHPEVSLRKGQVIAWLPKEERASRRYIKAQMALPVDLRGMPESWGAYCIKLEDQPTAAEVEATQKPETPTLDALEDEAEANRRMIERDGPALPAPVVTPAPGFILPGFRSEEPGLMVVAGFDHRFGRFA